MRSKELEGTVFQEQFEKQKALETQYLEQQLIEGNTVLDDNTTDLDKANQRLQAAITAGDADEITKAKIAVQMLQKDLNTIDMKTPAKVKQEKKLLREVADKLEQLITKTGTTGPATITPDILNQIAADMSGSRDELTDGFIAIATETNDPSLKALMEKLADANHEGKLADALTDVKTTVVEAIAAGSAQKKKVRKKINA